MTIKDFNQWKEDYGLVHEPNYSLHTEINCLNAFKAGRQSKQQEIDLLQDQVKELKENLHNLLSHCKSQENLLTFCDWDKGYSTAYANVVEDIEEMLR